MAEQLTGVVGGAELGQQDAGLGGEPVVVGLHVEQLPCGDGLLLPVGVVHREGAVDGVPPVRNGAVTTGELGEKGTEVGAGGEPD